MSSTAQNVQSFDHLSPYQQRQFVPENADLTELEQVTALYTKLLERELNSLDDLQKWVFDRSELESVFDQQGSILYILMTCQTDDKKRTENYSAFIEKIIPAVKPLEDQLNKKYLKCVKQWPLDEDRYRIYNLEIKTDDELFVEANIELETKVEVLSQEYQSICGAMMVDYDGKERTLPEMHKYLLEPNREVREKAWRASSQRRLKEAERLDKLFDNMMKLRNTIAGNAGFANYCDYKFKSLHRFDYTPQDCRNYHESIEQFVVPLWKEILEKRKKDMKVDKLRPWDTSVNPLGLPPLKPFTQVDELIKGCQDMFQQVDDQLGAQFTDMMTNRLLDLASRKGKAPGGYQSSLNESRKPFIFMNAVGVDSDVRTLLHEGGHAFHSLACAHDPLLDYRHGPMEFNEVASMGMELLADKYLNVFYNEDDERRSRKTHLEDIIFTLVWVATIDAFQQWIYLNPNHTREERRQRWLEIRQRFSGGVVNWDGLEEEHAFLWHRQLHIFEVPFYYIEYGIAQLGALQLWSNSKKDWAGTLEQYKAGLSLGGAKPLPALFQTAGLQFDFSEKTIKPLTNAIKQEIDSM